MYCSTIGFQVTTDYLTSLFNLDSTKFYSLLTEDIEMHHETNGHKDLIKGLDKVKAIYKEKFFDVTTNFDIQNVAIFPKNLEPEFRCSVLENKTENNFTYRAEFDERTTLHLVQKEGAWKIAKIVSIVSKKVLL